jgi:hypothetical protein
LIIRRYRQEVPWVSILFSPIGQYFNVQRGQRVLPG